jgi:hypothetical protein
LIDGLKKSRIVDVSFWEPETYKPFGCNTGQTVCEGATLIEQRSNFLTFLAIVVSLYSKINLPALTVQHLFGMRKVSGANAGTEW